MRFVRDFFFAVLVMTLAATLAQAQTPSGYKVSRRITLGGEGGWDYLTFDGEAHRLYIARATRVMVVDVESGKVVGEIPDTAGEEPTGLAMDTANRRLFSGCHNGTLVVTDADSGRNVQKLAIGNGVDAARFDKDAGLVFTSNGEGSISIIRQEGPDTYTSLANVATQKGARTMALDAGKHVVYTVANAPEDASGKPGPFELLVVEK
jgi:hypothetical protein